MESAGCSINSPFVGERGNMSSGGDRFMGGKETAEGDNGRILFHVL